MAAKVDCTALQLAHSYTFFSAYTEMDRFYFISIGTSDLFSLFFIIKYFDESVVTDV